MRNEGIIDSLTEFKRLNIGQIRFFLRKQQEYSALEQKTAELNRKLRKQNQQPKPLVKPG